MLHWSKENNWFRLVPLNEAEMTMVPNPFLDIIPIESWRKGIHSLKNISLKIPSPGSPLHNEQ